MAVQDFTKNYPGGYEIGRQILDQYVTWTRYFDCVVNPLTSGDDYIVGKYPAGTYVNSVVVVCTVVEGAADTIDVGDSDSATGYQSNTSLNSVAIVKYNTGLWKATAGNFLIHADAAITVAKFYLFIEYLIPSTLY